jgi:hypothetical protein
MQIISLYDITTPLQATNSEDRATEVTRLMSKDLKDFPGKEGLMITVEYPPGWADPI